MRKISRRDFLKSLGGLTAVSDRNQSPSSSRKDIKTPVLEQGKEVPVLCTACDRGCGVLVTVRGGEVVGFEGDPDHPVNQGFLCEEGKSLFCLSVSRNECGWRPHLFYRPAGSTSWETRDWDWSLRSVAQRIKDSREAVVKEESDKVKSIACIWDDALLTNEEGYLLFKFFQALGVPVQHKGRHPGALPFRDWLSINDGCSPDASNDPALTDWLRSGDTRGLLIWGGGLLTHGPENEMLNVLQSVGWLVLVDWFKTREDFAAKCERITDTCPRAEIFLLPAAAPWEKSGSWISAGRWLQWCAKATEPQEPVRPPLWMIDRLFKALRDLYREGGASPQRILKIKWDYAGNTVPDVELVAAEICSCFGEDERVSSEQTKSSAESSMTCGSQMDTGYWGGKALTMRRSLDHGRWGFLLPQQHQYL